MSPGRAGSRVLAYVDAIFFIICPLRPYFPPVVYSLAKSRAVHGRPFVTQVHPGMPRLGYTPSVAGIVSAPFEPFLSDSQASVENHHLNFSLLLSCASCWPKLALEPF